MESTVYKLFLGTKEIFNEARSSSGQDTWFSSMQQEFDPPTGYQFNMSEKSRQRHKETAMTVGTGLLVNYPFNLFFLWLFMDMFNIDDPFLLGTIVTGVMTIIAYTRVYLIRRHYEKK